MFDQSEWACHLIDVDHSWHEEASCRDLGPSLFFVERGEEYHTIQYAKEVCYACPVRKRCLEYATVNSIGYGIWGGMTAEERRRHARGQNAEISDLHKKVIAVYNRFVAEGSRRPAWETERELNVSRATVRRAMAAMRIVEIP